MKSYIIIIVVVVLLVVSIYYFKDKLKSENEILRDEALSLIDDYCEKMKNDVIEQYKEDEE
jgi:uncharacterized protein YpmB